MLILKPFQIVFSCFLAFAAAKPSGVAAVVAAPAAYVASAPVALAPHGFSYSTFTSYAAPLPLAAAAPAVAYAAPAAVAAPAPVAVAAPAAIAAPAPAPVAAPAPAPAAIAAPAPAPVAVAAPAPVAIAAPAVKSQYHAQDELGQASYGHAEPYQAHNAVQVSFKTLKII